MYNNIIAIPYRNRESHLDYFVKNTVPLIQEYLPNTKVVVIEQIKGKLFNRGLLLNIAFKEYQNKTNYFFTHDVDVNPTKETIQNVYINENIGIYRILSAHKSSLGGVVKFSHDIFFNLNGFPNNIWGWGIEDRALFFRSYIRNITITENTTKSFNILHHTSNAVKYTGEKLTISQIWSKNHIDILDNELREKLIMESGLNNVDYKIIERKNIHEIVEIIKVELFI
jgi:hypothetical protein